MIKKHKETAYSLILGSLTGAANGFFGGGGGMILVPLLTLLLKLKTKVAHATALFIILPVTAASAIVYFFSGNLRLDVLPPVLIGSSAGGALGAWLLSKLKAKAIGKIFAVAVLAAGIKTLFF